MKIALLIVFAAVIFVGCSKNDAVNPQTGGANPTGGGSKNPPDTTVKLTHDDSIHMATFKIKPQVTGSSVSGTNLVLKFNENVNLLFTTEGYKKISAVHLQEDFKKTMLAGFDYTTVAAAGNTTLNWVDDNLNNVLLKTVTDTVINNVKMVKINVHRPFTFFKVFATNKLALNEQALFANKTTDTVAFSSYSYYNQKNYLPVLATATMVYVK